ncbi:membrane protein insertion efficiency factor YidD [Georgenia sunbinii]|uniref:membrane protein insertion efficiency factor YidD n=1 Tax=Georgenia sunbinii TaxID=3117728 RepID=UPI002F2654FE
MTAVRRGLGARVLALVVRGYQLIVSPWLPASCKYYPSCSAYAITALERHGALRGSGLAAWRLLRCNPWSDGGVDEVPDRGGVMPWSSKRRGQRTLDVVDGGARTQDAPEEL